MRCVGELHGMVIIYQASVWGSQHNAACGKHANEAKSMLYNKTVEVGEGG